MGKPKLLLIGWDAADWQIIDKLMADGLMPTFARFLEHGVRANIASLSPTLSPILWTSIATGKRAYQHGIYGFVESRVGDDSILPVRSSTRQCKAVWNILNEAGLKTNLVNWWPSHPAEKVLGTCVSNQFHAAVPVAGENWPLAQASVFPTELREQLESLRLHPHEITWNHLSPFIPELAKLDSQNPIIKACRSILAHCSSVHNAATYIMEESEWDFMAVYQEALDHFSHLAMRYHPPQMPGIDDEEFALYQVIVSAAYRFHDMMLDRLLELAGPQCDVIILSDHGYHSASGRIENLPDISAAPALEHRKYGILAAAGPRFAAGQKIYGASLLDIVPTILHYFQLPIGEDMEGAILSNLFNDESKPSFIPSWELTEAKPAFLEDEHSLENAEILQQLEDLGYINLPAQSKAEFVRRELLYNRSLSLLEGNHYSKVLLEAKAEWELHHELRFGLLAAEACRSLQDLASWQEILQSIAQHHPNNAVVLYQKGMMALATNEPDAAVDYFQKLEKLGGGSPQLYNDIARTFLVQSNFTEAQRYFEKSLDLDQHNARALTGKAQVMLETGDYAQGLNLLEASLDLQFYQPQAHYLMALVAQHQGNTDLQKKALSLCLKQAPRHQAALRLYQQAFSTGQPSGQQTIYLVSGWPRSGTSMMMQLLNAAGLSLYAEDSRPPDEHNPDGYFEHPKVLDTGSDNAWLGDARGKAVKVVRPLLRYLPSQYVYKVIMMQRPLTEVVLSQEIMKGAARDEVLRNFPFRLALNLQREEERMDEWLSTQANFDVLNVEMERCINEAPQVLQEIESFLGTKLKKTAAAAIPSATKPRNKLGK